MDIKEEFLAIESDFNFLNFKALGIEVTGRLDDNNGTYYTKGNKTFYITFCEDAEEMVYGEEDGEETTYFDNTDDLERYDEFMVRGLEFLDSKK